MENEGTKIINNDYANPMGGASGFGGGMGGGVGALLVGALLGRGLLGQNQAGDATNAINSAIQTSGLNSAINNLGLQTANQTSTIENALSFGTQFAGVNQNVNEGFAGLRAEALTNAVNGGFAGVNSNLSNGFAGVNSALCSGFAGVNATVNSTSNNLLSAVNNLNANMMMESCKTQQAILNQTQVITSKMDANTIAILQSELSECRAKTQTSDISVNIGNTVTNSILGMLRASGAVK